VNEALVNEAVLDMEEIGIRDELVVVEVVVPTWWEMRRAAMTMEDGIEGVCEETEEALGATEGVLGETEEVLGEIERVVERLETKIDKIEVIEPIAPSNEELVALPQVPTIVVTKWGGLVRVEVLNLQWIGRAVVMVLEHVN